MWRLLPEAIDEEQGPGMLRTEERHRGVPLCSDDGHASIGDRTHAQAEAGAECFDEGRGEMLETLGKTDLDDRGISVEVVWFRTIRIRRERHLTHHRSSTCEPAVS